MLQMYDMNNSTITGNGIVQYTFFLKGPLLVSDTFYIIVCISFFLKEPFVSEIFYIIVVSCMEEYMSLFIYLFVYKSDTKNTKKEYVFYVYLFIVHVRGIKSTTVNSHLCFYLIR